MSQLLPCTVKHQQLLHFCDSYTPDPFLVVVVVTSSSIQTQFMSVPSPSIASVSTTCFCYCVSICTFSKASTFVLVKQIAPSGSLSPVALPFVPPSPVGFPDPPPSFAPLQYALVHFHHYLCKPPGTVVRIKKKRKKSMSS